MPNIPSSADGRSLRYPIGRFSYAVASDGSKLQTSIATIAELPRELTSAVDGLSQVQLDTPYREGGWTVRQLVHHVADSHMNACVRVRLALTEHWPAIKPYQEACWAELADARILPVSVSLTLLEALHRRWVALLESLTLSDWERGYLHPENGRQPLVTVIALYGWHGRHHTAHVTALRERMNW